MEEVGEVEALNDQVVNFTNITPTQKRVGLKVPVSNMAIDNAAFDLMSFVQTKFTLALRKYLAKKIYSQAPGLEQGSVLWLDSKGTITIGAFCLQEHPEGCCRVLTRASTRAVLAWTVQLRPS